MNADMIERGIALAAKLQRMPGVEGLSLTPYKCPAGYPTIGYGSRFYPDGREVKMSDPPITEAEAGRIQIAHIRRECLPVALEMCPNLPRAGMLAAILDFVFNVGGPRARRSTLLKMASAGNYAGAREQFPLWRFANGKEMGGLVRRARERQKLWDLV